MNVQCEKQNSHDNLAIVFETPNFASLYKPFGFCQKLNAPSSPMQIERLVLNSKLPIIDVRSEGEFTQGHIPGALNCPILNDKERHLVGICYKQKGQAKAIELGYELVEHKFDEKVQFVRNSVSINEVIVHCWRGGMRSKIFSELLEKNGFTVHRIDKGYKEFRGWVLSQLTKDYSLIILGGNTGSGKTEILKNMADKGAHFIDLEGLANHKGSAYGGIEMGTQPTQEQFENNLVIELNKCQNAQIIWVEDESRHLGKVNIPMHFRALMRNAHMIELSLPKSNRKKRIIEQYAHLNLPELISATKRLEKRLGNLQMNLAIEHLNNKDFEAWVDILLGYYDKLYQYGKSQRMPSKVHTVDIENLDLAEIASAIHTIYDTIKHEPNESPINTI